ncbi:MAG: 30S ribosomal protein S12 methylthiotransferase RimO [Victivallaceae bacterium]|nr:30S ribosomal protein S12 methylthiotransferase RimO [Victivallaceae bacterium]
MKSQHTLYLVSLGCSKNLVDTEVIAGNLLSNGFSLVFEPDEADLYIVNTCAFLPAAREEAFAAINDGLAWKKVGKGRKLIVAGCLTEWDKSGAVRKRFADVDLWSGVDDIAAISKLVSGEQTPLPRGKAPCWLYDENTPRLQLTLPHLAYLKIADGCNNCCTYCSIPSIRGALRSRPIASVKAEAEMLVANGVKELLVIAQDVTAYGMDRPADGETLPKLLEVLNSIPGDFWIRLLYTHPAHYTPEFIDFMARTDTKVLPYLDIPLQHISEHILDAMHRHIGKTAIIDLLHELRRRIAGLTLRTTFITGFPGETEAEFAELMDFIAEIKFERCGVFPYSAEPGTIAGAMPDQIPTELAEKRAAKLMRRQRLIMRKCNQSYIGKTLDLLIDDVEDGVAIARGGSDAPEIDEVVSVPVGSRRVHPGTIRRVKIVAANADGFVGEFTR